MTQSIDPSSLLTQLQTWMRQAQSVLVAYSGGVDSAVLMAVAHSQLAQNSLACIGISPSYPQRELKAAEDLAVKLGAILRKVETQEHLDPKYIANDDKRCYYCKTDLYDNLAKIAAAEGLKVIVDGNNLDDLGDYRPGRTAAAEHGVRSPFIELSINKAQVRAIAKLLGLPVWDKPSMPCLSSRVPHGQPIMPKLLSQIERAEDCLVSLGFRQFRVRHHGEIARIELQPQDMPRALELRDQLVEGVKKAGYRYVAIDLAGFKSGGFNPDSAPQQQNSPNAI